MTSVDRIIYHSLFIILYVPKYKFQQDLKALKLEKKTNVWLFTFFKRNKAIDFHNFYMTTRG